jgi:hypothetical protein
MKRTLSQAEAEDAGDVYVRVRTHASPTILPNLKQHIPQNIVDEFNRAFTPIDRNLKSLFSLCASCSTENPRLKERMKIRVDLYGSVGSMYDSTFFSDANYIPRLLFDEICSRIDAFIKKECERIREGDGSALVQFYFQVMRLAVPVVEHALGRLRERLLFLGCVLQHRVIALFSDACSSKAVVDDCVTYVANALSDVSGARDKALVMMMDMLRTLDVVDDTFCAAVLTSLMSHMTHFHVGKNVIDVFSHAGAISFRIRQYFPPLSSLSRNFVASVKSTLLNSDAGPELLALFATQNVQAIGDVYQFFADTEDCTAFFEVVGRFVTQEVAQVWQRAQSVSGTFSEVRHQLEQMVVEPLLALRSSLLAMETHVGGWHDPRPVTFHQQFGKATTAAPLHPKWTLPQLLAHTLGQASTESQVEALVGLLALVPEKDLFFAEYHKVMAHKLCLSLGEDVRTPRSVDSSRSSNSNSSLSRHAVLALQPLEDFIYSKLSEVDPANLALSRLVAMQADMALAPDLTRRFADAVPHTHGIAFKVAVLTQGKWPLPPPASSLGLVLPTAVDSLLAAFGEWYSGALHHGSRVIKWVLSLARADLVYSHSARQTFYLVRATAPQSALCMLFNSGSMYSIEELVSILGCGRRIVEACVASLSSSAFPLMERDAGGAVRLNAAFTSPRVKIACPPMKMDGLDRPKEERRDSAEDEEEAEEAKRTRDGVVQDRTYAVDACLVRLMKRRKRAPLVEVVGDVVAEMSKQGGGYTPEIRLIKRQIESLMEREYFAREQNPDSGDLLVYLA